MRKTGNIYIYTQRNLLKKGIQIRKLHVIKGISLLHNKVPLFLNTIGILKSINFKID